MGILLILLPKCYPKSEDPMPKRNLTFNFVSSVKEPGEYFDANERGRGLLLRVFKSGHKRWELRYRFAGKIRRYHIGYFPDLGLKDARDELSSLKKDIRSGVDPQGEKVRSRYTTENMTFRELASVFEKEYLKRLKESTKRDYRSRINRHLVPAFGPMLLSEIQRGHIRRLLKPMAEKKPMHANRVQAVLSKMFSFALQEEFTTNHPVKGMSKYGKETRRDRYYAKEEIRALWSAFEQQGEPIRSLLKVLLLTGQRLGETSRMKWSDIDTTRSLWVMPKDETKAGRSHTIPIVGQVKHILEALHQITGQYDYVFTSPMKNDRPVADFKGAVARIRDIDECPDDFRIHDMRRTVATYCAELGVDRTTLGKLLNHRGLAGDSHVTSIYDRHEYLDEKRQALTRWDSMLNQIITGEQAETKIFKIG